jgi:hypothetical protein
MQRLSYHENAERTYSKVTIKWRFLSMFNIYIRKINVLEMGSRKEFYRLLIKYIKVVLIFKNKKH